MNIPPPGSQSNGQPNVDALLEHKARHIHELFMTLSTIPVGDPGYDRLLQSVAAYQQAQTAYDYAAIIAQCVDIVDTTSVKNDIRACSMWLAWVARRQVEAIVVQQ